MVEVVLATLPGIGVLWWLFGIGVLLNLLTATLAALAFEALLLTLRGRPVLPALADGSVVVTAVLLALALPPTAPFWLTLVATGSAVVLGKQLYGGLGQNPFNPAMLGYVCVLVSFPLELTRWLIEPADPLTALNVWTGAPPPDALTGATLLDALKFREGLTVAEFEASHPSAGLVGGRGWEWVNLAFLVGGLWLLARRIFTWHAPVGMLLGLALTAALCWDGGSTTSPGGPLLHLFSGATMFGAFFIVTDPVSGASSPRGRLWFGLVVGVLVLVIRAWGGYPDAVAFAVLLANLCVPVIDRYSIPRPYGARSRRGAPTP